MTMNTDIADPAGSAFGGIGVSKVASLFALTAGP
jgi:hypothetical protein